MYDENHNSKLDKVRIVVDVYTHDNHSHTQCIAHHWHHSIFTSSEYILLSKFDRDVIKNDNFRRIVIAMMIDEMHYIDDWDKDFRSKYFELNVLRTRLSFDVSYLDLFVTLDLDTLKIVREKSEFHDCILMKTLIDRREINTHIMWMKSNLRDFENLRRFFFETTINSYLINKIVFYFDNKHEIQKFVKAMIDLWFSEWNYSINARRWISKYHIDMTNHDKKRVIVIFDKSNSSHCSKQDSHIRFLIASETYEVDVDNSNIQNVVIWEIFKQKHVFRQRTDRCARRLIQDFCFWIVSRWACTRMNLTKSDKAISRDSQILIFILNDERNAFDSKQSDVDESRLQTISQKAINQYNVAMRVKFLKIYIEQINFNCNKKYDLIRYKNVEISKSLFVSSLICCSSHNDKKYIFKHRFYSKVKISNSLFTIYMIAKLRDWRSQKIKEMYANCCFFVLDIVIFFDRYLKIIVRYANSLNDQFSLKRLCRDWTKREKYQANILIMCAELFTKNRLDSDVWKEWRINITIKVKRKIDKYKQDQS